MKGIGFSTGVERKSPPPKIIGISGQKQSGKDTLCNFLMKKIDTLNAGPWRRIAFADPVKDILCSMFGVSREWIEEWKVKEECPPGWDMNVRMAMINIGDRLREICPTVWIDKTLRGSFNRVISDVRYQNEARLVSERGFLIRVHNPRVETLQNPSETELIHFDKTCLGSEIQGRVEIPGVPYHVFISNDGTLEEFRQKFELLVFPEVEKSLKYFVGPGLS